MGREGSWPALPLAEWRDTCETLHMWTQIAGKVRLAQAPPQNHWWHVALYVTPRGLTTSAMPHGERTFALSFDLIDHVLAIETSDGARATVPLAPRATSVFHAEVMAALEALELAVRVWPRPVEVEIAIPFDHDTVHASYDRSAVERFRVALQQADRVLQRFRGQFLGKSSPVHFFWGAFDLAVTRFSGRTAPEHPGGQPNVGRHVMVEAYSHELVSVGWWPGNAMHPEPAFYGYAYPEPPGFREARVRPDGAHYDATLGEFLLPYEAVRTAPDPDAMVLAFASDVYAAGAEFGAWDRQALERPDGQSTSGRSGRRVTHQEEER
ncbi:MAG TPA: DUF5996 family protein [Gemmatimonadaceae bacterium]|nr:DUF5996 family protein [Gemmatimonadaceae bacterium]